MSPKLPLAALLALAAARLAAAADLELASRSGFTPEHGKAATGDATPVEPGALELEVAYAPAWNDAGAALGFDRAPDARTDALLATATRGLVAGVDAKISLALATQLDAARVRPDGSGGRGTGLGDLAVGARWRFLELPHRALELAVVGEAVVPVGAGEAPDRPGLSQGFWSGRLALVCTKDAGRFTANGELGVVLPLAGDARGLRSAVQANLAGGYHLLPWLQPELELHYQASIGPDAHVVGATAGVVVPWGGGRVVAALHRALWGRHAVQTAGAILAYKTSL